MTQVEAEETKANAEAKQHVEDGKKKAEDEKQKGEKAAEDAKSKGKEKSSGFFGWLADKAKAAFDGIKQAVSAAIAAIASCFAASMTALTARLHASIAITAPAAGTIIETSSSIRIAIAGSRAFADGLLPVPGLDGSRLTRFWANIAREAYEKGKW